MREYVSILNGLPIMYLIVVVAMVVVIGAMSMDAAFGWRKAKLRNEARTSYLFSRSITKFALYEGVLFISAGIALSLLMAWCALWFELAMGIADTYYLRVYEKYYQDQHGAETTEDTPSSATEPQKDAVPKL